MPGKEKKVSVANELDRMTEWLQTGIHAFCEVLQAVDVARGKWEPPLWQGCHLEIWEQMQAEALAWHQRKKPDPGVMTIGWGFDLFRSLFRLVRGGQVSPGGECLNFAKAYSQSLYDAARRFLFTPKTKPWANRSRRHKARGLVHGRVFRVNVHLKGVTPEVWREILVADCSLDCLNAILQAAMGWANHYDYLFRVDKQEYKDLDNYDYEFSQREIRNNLKGARNPAKPPPDQDSKRLSLSAILEKLGPEGVIGYTYQSSDPWDSWEHQVIIRPYKRAVEPGILPICTGGAMACPLEEDTHGPEDFMLLRQQLKSKDHGERKEWREWLDKTRPFHDFNYFDQKEATENMRRVLRG